MATTDEPKTDERIQSAAKFLGVPVTELKREIKEALVRQVANELAAESLKEAPQRFKRRKCGLIAIASISSARKWTDASRSFSVNPNP